MKCRSVACLWSSSPLPHRVTAAAALRRPPTLYTGGSDGSIVWWNISGTNDNQEIKPVAILCGHAAPIADLAICFPAANLADGKSDYLSNVSVNSSSSDYGALISVCTDGVLCIWSRGSGHCRRRRKMPPWVGNPLVAQAMPQNPRYVCVACCFIDSVHLLDHQLADSSEGGESLMDKDPQYQKPSKCTVVIVDSYTLSIVQTVFHGNLSIGMLRFMAVVRPVEDMEKQSVLLADSCGKLQCVPILKEPNSNGEHGTAVQRTSYVSEMNDSVEVSNEGLQVVAFSTSGQVLAHVYRTYCIFRLAASGTTIGDISFVNNELCPEEGSAQSHVIGGMFLESDDDATKIVETQYGLAENFVVWNNKGFANVYRITYSDTIFNSNILSVIPAVLHPLDSSLSICFIQLSCYLLRIETVCFYIEEPVLWKPHITTWLLPQQCDNNLNFHQECKMLSEGRLFVDWIANSTSPNETKGLRYDIGLELTGTGTHLSQQNSVPCPNVHSVCAADEKHWLGEKGRLISSSMVISESYYIPYAVVYGFHSGEIEVVHFNFFLGGFESYSRSQVHQTFSNVSKQCFLGHKGAVLCLAAHRMVGTAKVRNFNRVLVSGSMDCTIRIWDLDSGNLITVLHHHVAPVCQIILPPPRTDRPWNDCFLSVGEDSCVTLVSFETLRVERMFPGHPYPPGKVVWDGTRGYLACLCRNHSGSSNAFDALYIWDVKTGARERVLRGTASHSMFDHFCEGINMNSPSGGVLNGNTSASSLVLPLVEDANLSQSRSKKLGKGASSSNMFPSMTNMTEVDASMEPSFKADSANLYLLTASVFQDSKHPINCSCPFPGIAVLSFDLALLMSLCQKHEIFKDGGERRGNTTSYRNGAEMPKDTCDNQDKNHMKEREAEKPDPHDVTIDGTILDSSHLHGTSTYPAVDDDSIRSLEGCLLQFSLSFLHLWDVDIELDKLLMTEMKLKKPENFLLSPGLQGDRGSLTLTFPNSRATLELWKSSSEFSAMRSLTMVSLAQRMISWSHSCSDASSALAAFYTRIFLEKIPDVKPPLLQLLVSFWQDKSEHVRMAARTLFHCAASQAIPHPLCRQKANDHENLLSSPTRAGVNEHEILNTEKPFGNGLKSNIILETQGLSRSEESEILEWLESFEVQDWISCVGGTSQDAMTSHIIVAAALAIWYPSLIKPSLTMLVVHPLMKLVMAMNDKYSSTAAELLAEGMESTWKACIASEIPRLIGDILFQIEFVSGAPANSSAQNPAIPLDIRETLVGVLLPSLATADILGFLNVVESQIWSTASDSPVHMVSLMTLLRVIRGSPRNVAQYLDKVVNFILQTMDPSNSVMRKTCLQSSVAVLKEVVRIFPMVALNDTSTRLAVGDAIGEVNNASIRVYDMQSVAKIKILDANGPPGLPSLLGGASKVVVLTAISALCFSPDGEGLVAFSEHGLMIRWWSLGSAWWEKLSRNLVPVQCTKVIFVPPWEGFSANSTRLSIMASITGHDRQVNAKENTGGLSDVDRLKLLIQNLDLSYRLEWVGDRNVLLTRHGDKLGTFQL